MPHRAMQIVDAMVTALTANTSLNSSIYKNRTLTLSSEEGELPAVSVRIGADVPVGETGVENFAFIDSLLSLSLEAKADQEGDDEAALIAALVEMRRQIHITLQADITQGLAFVSDTRYGGAAEPTISTDGSRLVGMIASAWTVRYRMNTSDPA